jgi:hypothetical protein
MSFIVETITGDRRIQLASEEFVRPMSIGTNWAKLRIGLRCAVWYAGGNFSNVVFSAGVCQGQNGFVSTNTVDYIGANFLASMLGTFTQTVTSQPFAYSTSGVTYFKKTGSSVLLTNTAGASGPFIGANPQAYHSQIFLDIAKGSPNYTFNCWAFNSFAASQTDITRLAFLQALENETAPTGLSNVGANITLAYSGNNLFDSVSIYWNRSTPTLEISDIAICRFL